MIQLFECLSVLHKNRYTHADLKPENILIHGYTKDINDIKEKLSKLNTLNEIKEYISTLAVNDDLSSQEDDIKSNSIECISLITESDDSKESEENDTKKSHILLDEFIENPVIYISDLGSCVNINETNNYKKFYNTCYYTAPEVLLKLKCDNKVDIWAAGCTLYEILTGNVLFDPDDVSNMKSRYHISKRIMYLGDIPKYMKDSSSMRDVYFKTNGLIKGVNKIENTMIWNDLVSDKKILVKLILDLLELDPIKRIDARTALDLLKTHQGLV
jgi:serine/threonine-protein kinase SRPK3